MLSTGLHLAPESTPASSHACVMCRPSLSWKPDTYLNVPRPRF